MVVLAPILYSNATISGRHAPSLNAAFKELFAASRIKPQVLNTAESIAAGLTPVSGGSRTLAESILAGSGAASDHYENNAAGHAAADINNQRDLRNALGDDRFEAILAGHGWHNIQIDGSPFPTEPWHFANHDATPQTAGLDSTPFDNAEEDDMKIYEREVNSGVFGLGYPGGWIDIDNKTIPNTRDVLTQAFGAPIQQFGADYDAIKALHLRTKPAGVTITDADAARIASHIKPLDISSLTALLKSNQAAAIAAIGQVDENLLAQLGLKHA